MAGSYEQNGLAGVSGSAESSIVVSAFSVTGPILDGGDCRA
jgi:hypothetical protein